MNVLQLFAISTGKKPGPLRLSDLRSAYNITGTFSLRSLLRKVEAGTVVLWVSVRDFSILTSATNLSQLNAQWKTAQPSKATLVVLSQLLASVGCFIAFLSKDWRTVGIRGKIGALATLASLRVVPLGVAEGGALHPETPEGGWALTGGGAVAIFGGTGMIGTVLMAAPPTVEAMGAFIVVGSGVGLILVGVSLVAYGIYDISTSDTSSSQNVPADVDAGVPAQIGPTPAGVDPTNLPDTPVDPGSEPNSPPTCPVSCPTGEGDGGG